MLNNHLLNFCQQVNYAIHQGHSPPHSSTAYQTGEVPVTHLQLVWKLTIYYIIIIIIVVEFLTSQFWLGNIHLSWDVAINRIRLGGLICSLKKFLTIEHVLRITDFCSCIYVLGCRLSLVRLCDSDFGITPIDDITIGITCTAFCIHIAHISLLLLLLLLLLLFHTNSTLYDTFSPSNHI